MTFINICYNRYKKTNKNVIVFAAIMEEKSKKNGSHALFESPFTRKLQTHFRQVF